MSPARAGHPSLPAKILAIHDALAGVPHAFGGAIALAYYAEPRATVDIDVNVFVPVDAATTVLDPLFAVGADGTAGGEDAVATVRQDGQVRTFWDRTPIDLFFAYDPFHDAAKSATATVPFAGETIPILSAAHLAVCKVVFDRPKDWVDIEAMVAAGTRLDTAEIMRWVGRIAGDEDPRYRRIAALLTR